jgi:hypothetical protein
VIVNENYRRSILSDCLTKYLPWMDERRVEQTAGYRDVALEPVLRVEHSNVKFFDWKILKPLTENLVYISRTTDGHTFIALLRRHPPAELERGMNGDGARSADASQTRQRSDGLRGQPAERAMRARKYFVADPDCRVFFGSTAEEDREQLGRAERSCAVGFEPLARTLATGELSDTGRHLRLRETIPESLLSRTFRSTTAIIREQSHSWRATR